jgi:hypothetical protein
MQQSLKYFFLVIFLFPIHFTLFCQTTPNSPANQQKYWYLRQRMVDEFLFIGSEPGGSIPATTITYDAAYNNGNDLIKTLRYSADATLDLGLYMAILATELKLLRENGENYDNTEMELYYALNAFDRLDAYGEIIQDYASISQWNDCDIQRPPGDPWQPGDKQSENLPNVGAVTWSNGWQPRAGSPYINPLRNGWFIRNDGGPNILNYFPDVDVIRGQVYNVYDWSETAEAKFGIYNYNNPTTLAHENKGYFPSKIPSQDQCFYLMMGLMMTCEFAGDAEYNGVILKDFARELGARIMNYYEWTLNPLAPYFLDFWTIKSPITNSLPCNGGGESVAYSPSMHALKDYFNYPNVVLPNNATQGYLWGQIDCSSPNIGYAVNRGLYAIVTSISNTTYNSDMCLYATADGFDWGLFYLIRRALYPNNNSNTSVCDYDMNEAIADLNDCPCRGPHHDRFLYNEENGSYYHDVGGNLELIMINDHPELKGTYEVSPSGWNTSNRFGNVCGVNQNASNAYNPHQTGEYIGMDYMLLFNLANIVFGDNNISGGNVNSTDYTNMIHYYFKNAGPLQTNQSFWPVGFKTLKTDVIIPATTSVDSKAGNSIELLPGFLANQGSVFQAQISNVWKCNPNDQSFRISPNNPYVPIVERNLPDRNNFIDNSSNWITKDTIQSPKIVNSIIEIFPNPTNKLLNFKCENIELISVSLINTSGQIQKLIVNCDQNIDLSPFPNGIYTLIIEYIDKNNEYQQEVKQIIKTS